MADFSNANEPPRCKHTRYPVQEQKLLQSSFEQKQDSQQAARTLPKEINKDLSFKAFNPVGKAMLELKP